jgi:hypothetical protein
LNIFSALSTYKIERSTNTFQVSVEVILADLEVLGC